MKLEVGDIIIVNIKSDDPSSTHDIEQCCGMIIKNDYAGFSISFPSLVSESTRSWVSEVAFKDDFCNRFRPYKFLKIIKHIPKIKSF